MFTGTDTPGVFMPGAGFHAVPDELEAMAAALEPIGSGLVQRATTLLGQANRAGAVNTGWYTSGALDLACQQLRGSFEAAARRIDGFRAITQSNARNYRSTDERIQRHLRQLLDKV